MKTKKTFISVISVFMAMLMVLLNFTIAAQELTIENSNWQNKIDDSLKSKMENIDNDDLVRVSVWFSDINYDTVKASVKNELINEKMRSSNVMEDAIDLVFFNNSVTERSAYSTLSELSEVYSEVSTDEVQVVVEKEREVASELYQEYNVSMLEEILENIDATSNSRNFNSTQSKVKYVSRYAPNVEVMLTKEEIADIAKCGDVEEIKYIESNVAVSNREIVDDEEDEPYDMTFFDVTGLSTARDAWGLNGANMKVGMVESYHPSSTISDLATITRVYSVEDTTSFHAGLVASIMVGRTLDQNGTILFQGAIPSASLYSASVSDENVVGESELKYAVEALLDEGVTAINASISFPTGSEGFNEYGDVAKWYDHISAHHNAHLILSSSNYGSQGVKRTNTSYNAIVVGACDNGGTILSDSSYIAMNNFMNKPDIVAPGDVDAPIWGSFGTSFAAPMVTSAVIQLSQASAVLMSNPTLMKAVLLSSSKITNAMSNDANVYSTVNGTASAISQVYGAGMLNVTKAYSSVMTDLYYKTGTMSPYSGSAYYQNNLTKVRGKTLRFCLTWNKMNNINGEHTTNGVTETTLDNFKLTVTTPSGVVYTAQNMYDNKQVITFEATENGTYSYLISRVGANNSGEIVRYSIAYSKQ